MFSVFSVLHVHAHLSACVNYRWYLHKGSHLSGFLEYNLVAVHMLFALICPGFISFGWSDKCATVQNLTEAN